MVDVLAPPGVTPARVAPVEATALPDAARYPIVHHGGRWVSWPDAALHVDSLAMRYALVAFDAIRVYRGHDGTVAPFLLAAHAARLRNTLRLLGIPDPGVGDLDVVTKLVERNGVDADAYVRVTVAAGNVATLGDAAEPVLTAVVSRAGRKDAVASGRGLDVQVSAWQRAPTAVFPPAAKCAASYAGSRLAVRAARAAGYDECLLVTADGHVCESPTANVFVVHDGTLLTPPLSDGVLPGVTRRWVLDTAPSLGIEAREERLAPEDVRTADEAFLTGTAIEICPVRSVDGRRLRRSGDPVTARVADRFFAAVRETRSTGRPASRKDVHR